jgi:hypothetical protein
MHAYANRSQRIGRPEAELKQQEEIARTTAQFHIHLISRKADLAQLEGCPAARDARFMLNRCSMKDF